MKIKNLPLLLVCCMTTAYGFAQATSGKCGNNLTWFFDSTTDMLTISGTGEMYNYLGYNNDNPPWFKFVDQIKQVEIKDGVSSIGRLAFEGCHNLVSIFISSDVTSINISAFMGCGSLTSIDIESENLSYASVEGVLFNKEKTALICCPKGKSGSYIVPNSVISIEDNAFTRCQGLTSIDIPESVKSIGGSAFYHCENLVSISIPDSGVTNIEYWAFEGCISLKSFDIPSSITSIGYGVFCDCKSLTSVTIPDNITSIGGSAFRNCTGLTSITIPASVTNIIYDAFALCSNLTSIDVESENKNYVSESGVLFDKDKTTLIYCPDGKTGDYVIPSGVSSIGEWAFDRCSNLTSVTIPNSVMSIGKAAFWNYSALQSVKVGWKNPILIDDYTLYNPFMSPANITLIIPAGTSEAYRTAPVWRDFKIVESTAAIENVQISSINIYPNPVSESFTINGITEPTIITVLDITGKMELQQTVNSDETIVIGHLQNSIYFVNVKGETMKIVKIAK